MTDVLLFVLALFIAVYIVYLAYRLLNFLARRHIIFSFAEEGQAFAIVAIGQFVKACMAFSGRRFRYEIDNSPIELESSEKIPKEGQRQDESEPLKYPDYYEIEDYPETEKDPWDVLVLTKQGQEKLEGKQSNYPLLQNPFGGVRILGFPGVHKRHEYKFTWTSFEQQMDEQGDVINVARTHPDEPLDYIYLKEDIYATSTGSVETSDPLPIDVLTLLTIAVINPRKALFNVARWLEAVENQVRPVIREYIGTRTYNDLVSSVKGGGMTLQNVLRDGYSENGEVLIKGGTLQRILAEYGVEVRIVSLFGIEPPERYRDLTLRRYEGEQEAARIEKEYAKVREFGPLGEKLAWFDTLRKKNVGLTLLQGGEGSDPRVAKTFEVGSLQRTDESLVDAQGRPISTDQTGRE